MSLMGSANIDSSNTLMTGSVDHDGSILSAVTIACIAAISFVLVGISAPYPPTNELAHRILRMVFLVLLLFALGAQFIIIIFSRIRRSTWILSVQRQKYLDLKCLFMWIFGFAILFDAAVSLAANIECLLQNLDQPFLFLSYCAVHFLYIVYYSMQMIFVQCFKDTRFACQKTLNFGILLIVLTNCTIGFRGFVRYHGVNNPINNTVPGNSTAADKETVCYTNSKAGQFHYKLKPYIGPCRIEYAVLVAYFVLSFLPSSLFRENPREQLTVEINRNLTNSFTTIHEDDLNRVFLHPASNNEVYENRTTLSTSFRRGILMMGILANLILLVGSWFQINSSKSFKSSDSNFLFLIYKCYTLVLIAIVFHIWVGENRSVPMTYKLSASEYLLLFCGGGTSAVCMFDLLVSVKLKSGIDIAYSLTSIVTIVAVHHQVIMIFLLQRFGPRNLTKTLRLLLLLIAFANFCHWIADNFISLTHFQRERYIYQVFGQQVSSFDHYGLFPLNICFRLISAIDLLDIHRGNLP